MSIIVDSTLGLGILILFIKWTTVYIRRHRIKILYSGDYGRPPQAKVPLFLQRCTGTCLWRTRHSLCLP